jgi:hypothetical protein
METFYLGTHSTAWLEQTAVPLFVSRVRFVRLKRYPRALGPWALDSGAFSEIAAHGRFLTTAQGYAAHVQRIRDEVGRLEWAAPQDWMCEPFMLAKTGLTVAEHQWRTVASYLELQTLAPNVPWVPVLQGWTVADYLRHVWTYEGAGVHLAGLERVGLGSVCRRQNTAQGMAIARALAAEGIRLHGFGVKSGGASYGSALTSADSMAWSLHARNRGAMFTSCTHGSCSNCLRYALYWRSAMLARFERGYEQLALEEAG